MQSPVVVERFIKVQNKDNGIINVACLGGGPGSDVLGVLDYFLKAGFEGKLNIHLFDKMDKWGRCWETLETAIKAELSEDRVTVSFHDFDVTADDKNNPDVENADIITMHYFMEEVYSERDNPNVKACFHYIIQKAKPGALLLYSGMFWYQVIGWVHQLLTPNCKPLTPGTEVTGRWIGPDPAIQVDLKQEVDLKLFDDIRDKLENYMYYSDDRREVSQRYKGRVIYRLYQK
uniref:Uncharacterized protein n=1 Tax=Branchiostoma floridae TaxID=7739 RepID=C3YXE6_BRAFL|eukprot:XP_002599152.1 hypothetical protein BRAFLDRAFT_81819 [Branchiostoma floridae]